MGIVKTAHLLGGLALRHGTRASSARRFVRRALASAAAAASSPLSNPQAVSPEALLAFAERTLAASPPHDDEGALDTLVAEDLVSLLPHAPALARELEAWGDPLAALHQARDRSVASLRAIGISMEIPPLHVVATLPAYDAPPLTALSLDRADALAFGLSEGVYLRASSLLPYASEMALAHVLVHAALGRRSPELLGRGLEEGLSEVLGTLLAGTHAIGAPALESAYAALRLSDPPSPAREEMLARTRAAALLHRRHGLAALATLVERGRAAVKQAEAALARGEPAVDLPVGAPDRALAERLDRLEARARPIAVSPLAFRIAGALRDSRSVPEAAARLGLPVARAREAARELTGAAFVLLLDGEGGVLASDLALVLDVGALRYAVPRTHAVRSN